MQPCAIRPKPRYGWTHVQQTKYAEALAKALAQEMSLEALRLAVFKELLKLYIDSKMISSVERAAKTAGWMTRYNSPKAEQ